MRTITSTWNSADVDAEYAEAVAELLDDRASTYVIYEHSALGGDGHPVNWMQLVQYVAPDSGEERWAVTYTDNSSREVQESNCFDEADACYDSFVSELGQSDVESD